MRQAIQPSIHRAIHTAFQFLILRFVFEAHMRADI